MGKITRYHPISLHVVRGAVEYCGFKFGALKQSASDPTGLTATYVAEVTKLRSDCKDRSLAYVKSELQQCFNADIKVLELRGNAAGKLRAIIRTSIIQDAQQMPLEGHDYTASA